MQLQQRINAFKNLGQFLSELAVGDDLKTRELLEGVKAQNGWFTQENVRFALKTWGMALSEGDLLKWTSTYDLKEDQPKCVAVIMAGNVPLVGFHDFLAVLISGHKVLVKMSSNDTALLPFLVDQLLQLELGFEPYIKFSEERLSGFDAVIATGSNNTARYFQHYFGKYPNIIRKNRNSIAVLTGNETKTQLSALADDIFRYFGLGCRNVSKLFVPEGYDFDSFFNAVYDWKHVINDHKYMNNYDYNKAVYLMSDVQLLDNEFLLLKEDAGFSSPISVVFYEYYTDPSKLNTALEKRKDQVQCVVGSGVSYIPFGSTQEPELWDYADDVDTLDFLSQL